MSFISSLQLFPVAMSWLVSDTTLFVNMTHILNKSPNVTGDIFDISQNKSNKYAMTRNWSNQNPNLKGK